jgi:hypothetical protein
LSLRRSCAYGEKDNSEGENHPLDPAWLFYPSRLRASGWGCVIVIQVAGHNFPSGWFAETDRSLRCKRGRVMKGNAVVTFGFRRRTGGPRLSCVARCQGRAGRLERHLKKAEPAFRGGMDCFHASTFTEAEARHSPRLANDCSLFAACDCFNATPAVATVRFRSLNPKTKTLHRGGQWTLFLPA